MWFDLDTLFFTSVLTSAVAGALLLLTWLQNRDVVALALWGVAFVLAAAGLALIVLRGVIPDLWSIVIGNGLVAAGYGVGWLGVRKFEERPLLVPLAFVGAAIWLAVCTIDVFYRSPHTRAAVMATVVVSYTLLNAWELYRARETALMSRWPVIGVLITHAAIFLLRIPLAGTWTTIDAERAPLNWYVVIVLESILVAFCLAYLLGSIARERIVLKLRRAALADPLTGVPNRRAFFEEGERLLRRLRYGRRSAAVLAFDLDGFKAINDRFGHQAGDQVLVAFCEETIATLRAGDLFARIGGEEFACLLPNASRSGATQVAERIRARVAGRPVVIGEMAVTMTVSVGVAFAEAQSQQLVELIAAADRALYRAKANGRDRVELAWPRLIAVESPPIAGGAAPMQKGRSRSGAP